jgi:hypothetical protein
MIENCIQAALAKVDRLSPLAGGATQSPHRGEGGGGGGGGGGGEEGGGEQHKVQALITGVIKSVLESSESLDNLSGLVLAVLEAQEQGASHRHWAERVARDGVQTSTFRRALYRDLVSGVTDGLACVFAQLDINAGLNVLFCGYPDLAGTAAEDKQRATIQFATSVVGHLFSSTTTDFLDGDDSQKLQQHQQQQPQTSFHMNFVAPNAAGRYMVGSTGFRGQLFKAQFPQSHEVHRKLESLKPEVVGDFLGEQQVASGLEAGDVLGRLRRAIKADERLKGFAQVVTGKHEGAYYFREYCSDLVAMRFVSPSDDHATHGLVVDILFLAASLVEFRDGGELEATVDLASYQVASWVLGSRIEQICQIAHATAHESNVSFLTVLASELEEHMLPPCRLERLDRAVASATLRCVELADTLPLTDWASRLQPFKLAEEFMRGRPVDSDWNENTLLSDGPAFWHEMSARWDKLSAVYLCFVMLNSTTDDGDTEAMLRNLQFPGPLWSAESLQYLVHVLAARFDLNNSQCGICFEIPSGVGNFKVSLPCGHPFCHVCADTPESGIQQWLAKAHNCPTCRAPVPDDFECPPESSEDLKKREEAMVIKRRSMHLVLAWVRSFTFADETSLLSARRHDAYSAQRVVELLSTIVSNNHVNFSADSQANSLDAPKQKRAALIRLLLMVESGPVQTLVSEHLNAALLQPSATANTGEGVEGEEEDSLGEMVVHALEDLLAAKLRSSRDPIESSCRELDSCEGAPFASLGPAAQAPGSLAAAASDEGGGAGDFADDAGRGGGGVGGSAAAQGPCGAPPPVTMELLRKVAKIRAVAALASVQVAKLAAGKDLRQGSRVLLTKFAAQGYLPTFYLLKCILHSQGRDGLFETVQSEAVVECLGSQLAVVMEDLGGGQQAIQQAAQHARNDPFLVYGEPYVLARNAVEEAAVGGVGGSLLLPEWLARHGGGGNRSAVSLLSLAVSRVVSEHLLEESGDVGFGAGAAAAGGATVALDGTPAEVEDLQAALQEIEGVTDPQAMQVLTAPCRINPNPTNPLRPAPGQSAANWRMSQLATHALSAVSLHTSGPAALLRALCQNPGSFQNCLLPAMATDPRTQLAQALGTGGWYTCQNGHLYSVGQCGRPMERGRCPVNGCGAVVGGEHHNPVAGNTSAVLPTASASQYQGYTIRAGTEVAVERNLSPASVALLRIFIHASLLGAVTVDPQQLGTPLQTFLKLAPGGGGGPAAAVSQYLMEMLTAELEALRTSLGKTSDEATTLVHLALKSVLESKDAAASATAALTPGSLAPGTAGEAARQIWEDSCVRLYFSPLLLNAQDRLAEAATAAETLGQQPAWQRRVLRQLSDENESGGTGGGRVEVALLQEHRRLYRFRSHVTVSLYRRKLAEAPVEVRRECQLAERVLSLAQATSAMKHVPAILKLQRALVMKLRHCLDRKAANETTIGDMLLCSAWFEGEDTSELMQCVDSFGAAWEILSPLVSEFPPGEQAHALLREVVGEANDAEPLNAQTPLSVFTSGTVAISMVFYLLSKHNELVGSADVTRSDGEEGAGGDGSGRGERGASGDRRRRVEVPLSRLSVEHLICLEEGRDYEPLLLAYHTTSPDRGNANGAGGGGGGDRRRRGTRKGFDHLGITAELKNLVRGKPFVSMEEVPIHPGGGVRSGGGGNGGGAGGGGLARLLTVAYRSDVGDLFTQLATNIPQDDLSLETQDSLLADLAAADEREQGSGVCAAFDAVQQAVGFLYTKDLFSRDMLLGDYMTRVLCMSDSSSSSSSSSSSRSGNNNNSGTEYYKSDSGGGGGGGGGFGGGGGGAAAAVEHAHPLASNTTTSSSRGRFLEDLIAAKVQLRHVRSLWTLLDGALAEALVVRSEDCFPELSKDYKEPLEPDILRQLERHLQETTPGRRRALGGGLRRLCLSFERTKQYKPSFGLPVAEFWPTFASNSNEEVPADLLAMVEEVPMTCLADAWRTVVLAEIGGPTTSTHGALESGERVGDPGDEKQDRGPLGETGTIWAMQGEAVAAHVLEEHSDTEVPDGDY